MKKRKLVLHLPLLPLHLLSGWTEDLVSMVVSPELSTLILSKQMHARTCVKLGEITLVYKSSHVQKSWQDQFLIKEGLSPSEEQTKKASWTKHWWWVCLRQHCHLETGKQIHWNRLSWRPMESLSKLKSDRMDLWKENSVFLLFGGGYISAR